jgi:O-antigen ligase
MRRTKTMSDGRVEAHALGGGVLSRLRLVAVADALAVALAVSLPWSTSATSILAALWLVALVPTLDPAAVRRELVTPAGGLPVLLWGMGALGMLWADGSWSERLAGLSGYHKLLAIPLLLAQFRRCGRIQWVLLGFLASSALLLFVSWLLVLVPGIAWRGKVSLGVPVKDYIAQSAVFSLCVFGLVDQAAELWRRRPRLALLLLLAASAFMANIVYVATGRTTLVAMPVLLLLLGFRRFAWKGVLAACLIGAAVAAAVWASSPYLRARVSEAVTQAQGGGDAVTPVGLRLEYWRKSLDLIAEAPVAGHGTGSIPRLFRRDAAPDAHYMLLTDNPHNQLLTVAIELGLMGAAVLIALWIAHLALFRATAPTSWFGLVVVVQGIVGSMFNSHLFDFTHGWVYVIGVGIFGGAVLHAAAGPRPAATGGSAT